MIPDSLLGQHLIIITKIIHTHNANLLPVFWVFVRIHHNHFFQHYGSHTFLDTDFHIPEPNYRKSSCSKNTAYLA